MTFFQCGTYVCYRCWHKMAISTCIVVMGGAYEASRLFTWKENLLHIQDPSLNLCFGHFLVSVSKYTCSPTPPHTESMAEVSTCVLVCLRRDVLTLSHKVSLSHHKMVSLLNQVDAF